MPKRLLLKPAAKELGVSEFFLRNCAKSGKIPCLKSGNRYIFDVETVNEYLNQMALNNMADNECQNHYGKLRKIMA